MRRGRSMQASPSEFESRKYKDSDDDGVGMLKLNKLIIKFSFLIAFAMSGCFTATGADEARSTPSPQMDTWSVSRIFNRQSKGSGAYNSVTIDSFGKVTTNRKSSGSAVGFKPINIDDEFRCSPEDLAALSLAVNDPELFDESLAADHKPEANRYYQIRLTSQGRTVTFHSDSPRFSGAAGRLHQAIDRVAPDRTSTVRFK